MNQGPGVSSDKNPILGLNPLFGNLEVIRDLIRAGQNYIESGKLRGDVKQTIKLVHF